jgi:hypothetical protein
MMKPSLRQSKWIYEMHDLDIGQESYDILKMFHAVKLEVPIWKTRGSGFHRSDPNLTRDFHHIWLGFSDS